MLTSDPNFKYQVKGVTELTSKIVENAWRLMEPKLPLKLSARRLATAWILSLPIHLASGITVLDASITLTIETATGTQGLILLGTQVEVTLQFAKRCNVSVQILKKLPFSVRNIMS